MTMAVATMRTPAGETIRVESPNAIVPATFVAHGKRVENPTLFMPFLRLTGTMEEGTPDRDQWDRTWESTTAKRNEACLGGNESRCRTFEVILGGLTKAEFPFARLQNLSDGRWWGKFYDASVDTVTIRPSPTNKLAALITDRSAAVPGAVPFPPQALQGIGDAWGWIEDTVSDIGGAIVEFADSAWEILEDGIEAAWEFLKDVMVQLLQICDLLKKYLPPDEKKEVALAALAVVAPGVGSSIAGAIALADKICGAIAVLAFAMQGPLPPPPLNPQGRQDADDEGTFIQIVQLAVWAVGGAAEPQEPERVIYPPGTFSVYNPNTKRYHVLVNLT